MQRNSAPSLRVLVVWEPMLATDWRAPVHGTLARIPDHRAMQFWDPLHLVAQSLRKFNHAHPAQPKPDCCVDRGFFWDEAILYPPHSNWRQAPAPVFWNGTVVRVSLSLEKALQARP